MPRPRSTTLTDGELQLMKILWNKGRATMRQVVAALPRRRQPAYSTVLTMLRILEQNGYARHEKVGRAFAYVPVLAREQARRTAIQRLVSQLFNDSPGSLARNIIENEDVDAAELEALRSKIEGLR